MKRLSRVACSVAMSFCALAFLALPTQATHLGPIVFGQTRSEIVTVCLDRDDALFYFEQTKESLEQNEAHDVAYERVRHLHEEERCGAKLIIYVPIKTLEQAGPFPMTSEEAKTCRSDDGSVRLAPCDESSERLSLVEAKTKGITIFVIPYDEAPPPK